LTFGKHRLFERVSPKKSWEGAVFGFIFSVLTMITAKMLVLDYLSYQHAIVLGLLIGVFGQLGDLIESRFKRDAGVKDSSSLIPGHGGVYDRFDSLVYISPIVYLYIDFIVLS
jgi:phosphatidate cytidylyltransferase